MLAFVVVYLIYNSKIIDVPAIITYIEFAVAGIILLALMASRYRKFPDYYQKKLKDIIYVVAFLAVFVLFSIFLRAILRIPLDMYLANQAKDSPAEHVRCEIVSVSTLKVDKIQFRFNERKYWRFFSLNDLKKNDVVRNYYANVALKKTEFGAYYVKEINLVKK